MGMVAHLLLLTSVVFATGLMCNESDIPRNAHRIGPSRKLLFLNSCLWVCDKGFVRHGTTCCRRKPRDAVWWGDGCIWRCRYPSELIDGVCVDATVAEVVMESQTRDANRAADDLVDALVEDRLAEMWEDAEADGDDCYPLKLIDGVCVDATVAEVIVESQTGDANRAADDLVDALVADRLAEMWKEAEAERRRAADDGDDLVDRIVDKAERERVEDLVDLAVDNELKWSLEKANAGADVADKVTDAFLSYQEAESDAYYDPEVADVLASDAARHVDDLHSDVEHLRATIRFQNDRIRKKKHNLGSTEEILRLQEELKAANEKVTKLKDRSKAVERRLLQATKENNSHQRLRDRTLLSVYAEPVEAAHTQTSSWLRINYAILDTGNAGKCTISKAVAKKLGLSKAAVASTGRSVRVEGIIPGRTETWPLVRIKLRIKGHVFAVDAAVGGTTPILVSYPDVIQPLMREHGYVLGPK